MPCWPMNAPASSRERALPEAEAPGQFDLVPLRWRELYGQAVQRLGDARTARWFVEDSSGGTWPAVLDEPVPARAGRFFLSMVQRREAGEPVQYVLGHWAFRQLDLMVDRRVLIPRPETEVVVEVALEELARLEVVPPLVVDLGTGSGAIALSIASEQSRVMAWATDISEDALAVASANLAGLGVQTVGRVRLVHGSWWEALPESLKRSVTLVVANPPYVAVSELAGLPAEVSAWEPVQALVAGPTGLEALEEILAGAADWLADRSALVAEIAPHQADDAKEMALKLGLGEVLVRPDLAGLPRAIVARTR
jgi:release factor glutamine methyltransferase